MKSLLILLIVMFSSPLLANELKVEINPTKPVAGEVFQAYFRIFTDADEEPAINFSPSSVEVVGKSNQGISTRTVYANGKLTVTRELTIVYDLVAAKPGYAALRDIRVDLGGNIIKHPTVSFNVLKEAEEPSDVFVMADVPKKTLFLGEGVVVRYYLYSKVPVMNLDIKRYPKLNNFLKRFIQEPERTERVAVDGQLYMRTQIYAAKLYPEKTGELKVDSLQLSATYPNAKAGDPFGAFGLSKDYKTRSFKSETIKLQILPLPQPAPPHFTGLVGQHDFQLQIGQNRLIVNEPLEVKLVVTGVGALENLEAPDLIDHPGLEEFETNGDLKISSAENATKVFDYTFLAKENLTLDPKEFTLSYFDPNTQKYVSTELKLPEIVVAGGQATEPEVKAEKRSAIGDQSAPEKPKNGEFNGPADLSSSTWKTWLPYINLSLASLAVLISLGWIVRNQKFSLPAFHHDIPAAFKKGNFQISEFVQWISPLIKETGKSPSTIIKESPLPEESKRYFIDLLNSNDYKEYSLKKNKSEFRYQSGHFRELGKYIESIKNESH
ncbi:MAG: hypothetical protein ACLGHN_05365 [Bacteriovoracia bacterium]